MLERFYLIVDHPSWLERFLPLGLKLVQLRMKDVPISEMAQHIRYAKALCDRYNCTLIVNDFWQQALDEGCTYVHLGQEDLLEADFSALRSQGVRFGLSTHSEEELENALRFAPDYIALGPIYFTQLKAMQWQPQGLEKLRTWRNRIGELDLVAIGGFNLERAQGAFAHGASSVCVVSDVLQNANPEKRLQEWLLI